MRLVMLSHCLSDRFLMGDVESSACGSEDTTAKTQTSASMSDNV